MQAILVGLCASLLAELSRREIRNCLYSRAFVGQQSMLRAKFTTVEIGPISSAQLVTNLVPTGLPTSKVYKVRNLFCDCTHGGGG